MLGDGSVSGRAPPLSKRGGALVAAFGLGDGGGLTELSVAGDAPGLPPEAAIGKIVGVRLPFDARKDIVPPAAPRSIFVRTDPDDVAARKEVLPLVTPRHNVLRLGPGALKHIDVGSKGKRGLVRTSSLVGRSLLREEAPEDKRKLLAYSETVDQDATQAVDEYLMEELLSTFMRSGLFRHGILATIIAVSILVGIGTDESLNKRYDQVFSVINYAILTIFTLEILIKWAYNFGGFWTVPWNLMDFTLVAISILTELAPATAGLGFLSSGRIFRIFRVLRALRTLRSISALQSLQMIVETILDSLPDMANVTLLILIVMFIFACVGVDVFGEAAPDLFGDLGSAFYTLFALLTQDSWEGGFWGIADGGYFFAAAAYYVSFFTIGAFVMINIIVGVAFINLQVSMAHVAKEKAALNRQITSGGLGSENTRPDEDGTLRKVAEVQEIQKIEPRVWRAQRALFAPDLSNVTAGVLENYYLMLMAVEDNLAEFKRLKDRLRQIAEAVEQCNREEDDDEEGAPGRRPESALQGGGSVESESEEEEAGAGAAAAGDVLSRVVRRETMRQRRVKDRTQKELMERRTRVMHSLGIIGAGALGRQPQSPDEGGENVGEPPESPPRAPKEEGVLARTLARLNTLRRQSTVTTDLSAVLSSEAGAGAPAGAEGSQRRIRGASQSVEGGGSVRTREVQEPVRSLGPSEREGGSSRNPFTTGPIAAAGEGEGGSGRQAPKRALPARQPSSLLSIHEHGPESPPLDESLPREEA
eukprot:tig00001376_g8534.t1